jgi:hypothetical protein
VEVPHLTGAELRKALPLLVGDQVPIDIAQAVLDFALLEEIRTSDGAPVPERAARGRGGGEDSCQCCDPGDELEQHVGSHPSRPC